MPTPSETLFESHNSRLFWFTSASDWPDLELAEITADELLAMMKQRLKSKGTPLPEGFVPPPGVDVAALLKQLPWPPADTPNG